MKSKFEMFQTIILKKPVHGDIEDVIIPEGTSGAIVEFFDEGRSVMVELFDETGWTIDIATLPASVIRAATAMELDAISKRELFDIDKVVTPNSA
jgi:hypothetical protein